MSLLLLLLPLFGDPDVVIVDLADGELCVEVGESRRGTCGLGLLLMAFLKELQKMLALALASGFHVCGACAHATSSRSHVVFILRIRYLGPHAVTWTWYS